MPICQYEKLTPDLEPLEEVKIDLNGINLLQLKDNFNQEEVQHFVDFLGRRIYAYQVLRFLDFLPNHSPDKIKPNAELIKDYTNKINEEAGLPAKQDFWKFTLSIKDSLVNKFKAINNGEDNVQVDWVFSCVFLTLTELQNVLLFNQEDLPFKEAEGCYFGRSVLARLIQEYFDQHREIMMRNFNILQPSNNPVLAAAAKEHLSKQRDIKCKRAQTEAHLASLKCQKTGKTGMEILKAEFDVV